MTMNKKKPIIWRLLPWLILLAALAALVVFVGIPLYAPQQQEELEKPEVFYYEGDKKPIVMENDSLRFELNPTNTQFKLTEKSTGREWTSVPADADKDKKAVTTHKGVIQSTLLLYYSPKNGTDIERNNYQYSIENGNYKIEALEDGSVKVTYAIGQIEKTYKMPYAITAERFKSFTEKMGGRKKMVENAYQMQSPEAIQKLSEESRNDLIARYPQVVEQTLYILKDTIKDDQKKTIQDVFASQGYTDEDFELDQLLIAGKKEKNDPLFNVAIIYSLEGDEFVVSVPFEEIRYRSDYPVTYLTVLPMFGAAGTSEEGYVLVPEGGGALIRYNNGKLKQNSYYADLYGWDYAIMRSEVRTETEAVFPVFGMTKNDGAFICVLENGASYAGVYADISMRNNSYNFAYAKYHVLHSDKYNVSSKTEEIVKMFEKNLPQDTIVQRYLFADEANYVSMAKTYGDYLKNRYEGQLTVNENADLPVSVEMVGAISKTVVKAGMPVDASVAATTFSDAEKMLLDIQTRNVQNLSVRFTGWSNGGVNQKVLTRINVVRQLGGESGMKKLISTAKEAGVPLYFDGISCFAYDSGVLRGFTAYNDAARYTTREQVKLYPYSFITYLSSDWRDPFYLVQPQYASKMADNLISYLDEVHAAGVAFRDIGSLLSADYNAKNNVTREQVKQMNIDTLAKAAEKNQLVMVKQGFDFTLPYVDLITDMDLYGTDYNILDENVPFYQIAIHGMVEYTGRPVNVSADWHTEVLRCAEYGAGLSFTFMNEDAKLVQETFHSDLYGAYYADWADVFEKIVNKYQTSMAGLNSISIVDHEILKKNVTVTTYEDGRKVYVNYSDTDYAVGEVVVPARDYVVVGRDF